MNDSSAFYGEDGDDSVTTMNDRSYFDGGDGNDTVTTCNGAETARVSVEHDCS